MPDVVFNSGLRSLGIVGTDGRKFSAMLTTSSYAPNGDTHVTRADVTNEIPNGGGYSAGGKLVSVTVQPVNNATDSFDITFGPVDFPSLTASDVRQVVFYAHTKSGAAAATDALIMCVDLGSDIDLTSETLTINAMTLRYTKAP